MKREYELGDIFWLQNLTEMMMRDEDMNDTDNPMVMFLSSINDLIKEKGAEVAAGLLHRPMPNIANYYLMYGDARIGMHHLGYEAWPTASIMTPDRHQVLLMAWRRLMALHRAIWREKYGVTTGLVYAVMYGEPQADNQQIQYYIQDGELSDEAWETYTQRIVQDVVKRHNRLLVKDEGA